ncbi:MAG: ClpXP protease specificity-enhancing factor SspB [Acidobacteriota bacterium]|nr:ClpXP protease specificity-enhancing factor SspB [Acidobacteriota bacterium]
MTEHTIDYPGLVFGALRAAVARVLREAAEQGLPGDHHFYVTFRTDADGVEMPPGLRREYPDELTIVLQHQFWNFAADDSGFEVTLRFSGRETHLRVPFAAMTAFADPSVEFGVQLAPPQALAADNSEKPPAANPKPAGSRDGTVIAFDRDRKRD